MSVDTSSMTDMINSFLPLIVSIIGIMIPIIFLRSIMNMIKKLFDSFS